MTDQFGLGSRLDEILSKLSILDMSGSGHLVLTYVPGESHGPRTRGPWRLWGM